MKRKIIKLAEKTLVVSLPSSWVASQELKKGDEVDVAIEDNKLLIQPPLQKTATSSITIDVANLSERVLRWEISSLHKQGYDEIIVTHYSEDQQKIIEHLLSTLFVGFMVKEKTHLRIVIGQVAAVDPEEFDATLRRAFRLLNTQIEELITAFENQDVQLLAKQISHEHDTNKLTNFCERLLNKSLDQKDKGHFWYVIAWNLEKISDNFKYLAQHFKDAIVPLSEETKKILHQVQEFMDGYYNVLYSFSFEKLTQLTEQKKTLDKACVKQLAQSNGHEAVFMHYLHIIVMQIADFSASIIALRYEGENE